MTTPRRVDLNADLGEECGDDEAMLAVVTTANVACGGHAGGGEVLRRTLASARDHGVAVGAHPSFPDRAQFGRRSLLDAMAEAQLVDSVAAQLQQFAQACDEAGIPVSHVKPHGALYNDAMVDARAATIVLDAMQAAGMGGLPVMGLPGSVLQRLCLERAVPSISEGFADRAYASDGTLVPRSREGAVLHDVEQVVSQALDLARGQVRAIDGSVLAMPIATLCVHGDTPGAVAMTRAIADALIAHGITVGR